MARAESELVHAAIEPLQVGETAYRRPLRAGGELEQLLTLLIIEGAHRLPEPTERARSASEAAHGEGVPPPGGDVDEWLTGKHVCQIFGPNQLRELRDDVRGDRDVETA